jgi:hypothetical protein
MAFLSFFLFYFVWEHREDGLLYLTSQLDIVVWRVGRVRDGVQA